MVIWFIFKLKSSPFTISLWLVVHPSYIHLNAHHNGKLLLIIWLLVHKRRLMNGEKGWIGILLSWIVLVEVHLFWLDQCMWWVIIMYEWDWIDDQHKLTKGFQNYVFLDVSKDDFLPDLLRGLSFTVCIS